MGLNYNEELRSLISSKFDNEAKCAAAMGWSRQKLNKITTGRKEPDLTESKALAKILGVTIDRIASFF